ncbi:unnamed protein product [Phyllotreta striolata]|uniref:Uncharacterized protein n=1 Tax=Phyllotreta striolata TaxID=444603 RepID=A0A9P0GTL3_PHYSR|nr:unnamed protein product [Phyllotreta striolata]
MTKTNHSLIRSELHLAALKSVKYFLVSEMSRENEHIETLDEKEIADKEPEKPQDRDAPPEKLQEKPNEKPFIAKDPRPWYRITECWIYLLSVFVVFSITAWVIIVKVKHVNAVLEMKRINEELTLANSEERK